MLPYGSLWGLSVDDGDYNSQGKGAYSIKTTIISQINFEYSNNYS